MKRAQRETWHEPTAKNPITPSTTPPVASNSSRKNALQLAKSQGGRAADGAPSPRVVQASQRKRAISGEPATKLSITRRSRRGCPARSPKQPASAPSHSRSQCCRPGAETPPGGVRLDSHHGGRADDGAASRRSCFAARNRLRSRNQAAHHSAIASTLPSARATQRTVRPRTPLANETHSRSPFWQAHSDAEGCTVLRRAG